MKLKRLLTILCVTILGASLFTGCGTQTETAEETTVTTAELETEVAEQESTEQVQNESLFGQITAIDGDTITLALAEMPERTSRPDGEASAGEMPEGEAPDGEAPAGEMPEREAPEGEAPDGEAPDGEAPAGEAPDGELSTEMGEMPQGGMEQNLTLTGETVEITVTDSTKIEINGEEKTVADLAVEDIIQVEMDGETVISISSGMMGGRNNGGAAPDMEPSTENAPEENQE